MDFGLGLEVLPVLSLVELLPQGFVIRDDGSRLHKVFSILLPDTLQQYVPLDVVKFPLAGAEDGIRLHVL